MAALQDIDGPSRLRLPSRAFHQARQDRGRQVVAHPEPAYSLAADSGWPAQQPLRTGTLSGLGRPAAYMTLGDQNRRGYRQGWAHFVGRTALARAGTKRAALMVPSPLARSYPGPAE